MNNYFSGFDTKEITLFATDNVKAGAAVGLKDAITVTVPLSGAAFCGVCTAVRNKHASVVLKGHTIATYSGTAPTLGYCKLVCDGNGGVKVSDSGREYLVVEVDTNEKTADIIM